jgi:hypothetical protein
MRDAHGVKKLQEFVEMSVPGLVKFSVQKEAVSGAPEKDKTAISERFLKLGKKIPDVFLEKIMAAGIETRCIQGTHECGDKRKNPLGERSLLGHIAESFSLFPELVRTSLKSDSDHVQGAWI